MLTYADVCAGKEVRLAQEEVSGDLEFATSERMIEAVSLLRLERDRYADVC